MAKIRRRILRLAILASAGLILLGVSVALILWHMGGHGLRDWIGAQIQNVADDCLNPKLSFTDLSYQYPLGVSLRNLHLSADDPANPGHTIDIIACDHAEISLAEIPSIGKPIVIEKIELDSPLISAVAVEPRSKKFVGFSNLVRGGSSEPSPEQKPSAAPKKLSDIFRMRLVQLTDGRIVYDPRIPGTVAMKLDQINTLLKITPTDAGWYKLDTIIARKPVFQLAVAGELNLDTISVREVGIKLLADLGQDKLDYLPPELQALLKQYDCTGKLNVEIAGTMPLTDPLKGQVKASVTVDHANLAMNGLRFPLDNLDLEASFADRKMVLSSLKIAALGGTADLSGAATLNDRLDANLHLHIAGMVLEKMLGSAALASIAPATLGLDFNVAGSLKSIIGEAPAVPGQPLAAMSLRDFHLTASDPVRQAHLIDVVACKSLDISMTQPILPGRPVVIDKIILEEPSVSAVSVSPGAMQFIGIPNIPARSGVAVPDASPEPAMVSAAPARVAPEKISDLIQVKTFQLRGAKFSYDARIAGTQPMVLDDINTSIDLDGSVAGAYKINTEISHKPFFSFGIDGSVNIDDPGLQNFNLKIHADLTQPDLDFLPPQLQLVLTQTKARGMLEVDAAASVAMADPLHGKARFDASLNHLDLSHGQVHLPVENVLLSAQLRDGKMFQKVQISALKNVFDLEGTTTLNDRLDSDMTLKMQDVRLDSLSPLLTPWQPAANSATTISGEFEIKSPIMVAMGAVTPTANEPAASLAIRNFKLTTPNPITPTSQMDFLSVQGANVALASAFLPGRPLNIDRVTIDHPSIRAIAMAPYSEDFAGFADLQHLVGGSANPDSTRSPRGSPVAIVTATVPSNPVDSPANPPRHLSDVFRLRALVMNNLSIYYDPRIERTFPMSLGAIPAEIDIDSDAGDAYRFSTAVVSKPDLNLKLTGRVNVNTLVISPLDLELAVDVGNNIPRYLLPQIQAMLKPYDPEASAHLKVTGAVPVLNPTAADLWITVLLDNVKATAGDYRIPIDHVRLPLEFKAAQIHLLDSNALGGATVAALGGVANVTGIVTLDDQLHTSLALTVDGMLLQRLMDAQISQPKKDLVGALHTDVRLINAPLLTIAAQSAQPPTPVPSASPKPPSDVAGNSAAAVAETGAAIPGADAPPSTTQPSAAVSTTAPASTEASIASTQPATVVWGTADIELTHARLAGLEVIQGISNIAKGVFSDLLKKNDNNNQVVPEEKATVVLYMTENRMVFTKIRYEGELLAADGYGYITLDQYADLCLTGGPISKLAGKGSFANWVKEASDSLLYYRVVGPLNNLKYEVKGGDGKPIVQGAEKIADKGVKAIGKGLDKAGSFIGGLFKHKDKQ